MLIIRIAEYGGWLRKGAVCYGWRRGLDVSHAILNVGRPYSLILGVFSHIERSFFGYTGEKSWNEKDISCLPVGRSIPDQGLLGYAGFGRPISILAVLAESKGHMQYVQPTYCTLGRVLLIDLLFLCCVIGWIMSQSDFGEMGTVRGDFGVS